MALPATRTDFKAYCLRNLGSPVITINVDDTQVDDRIDEALLFWYDWAYEGTERMYYKYQLTQTDFTNKYITLPDNIIGAVRIFDLSTVSSNIQNPFNIQWQIVMNDMFTISSVSLIPYYTTFMHLQFLQQMLVGQQPIRYNRNTNQLYLDMDWSRLAVGQYVIVECFQVIDPTTYPDVWKDRQLLKLATAYIKRQWATNMKKYKNIELLGGNMLTGQELYDEAMKEIEEAEDALMNSSMPPIDMIG